MSSQAHAQKGQMIMLFMCYPRCTTCKKAQKWLDEKSVQYEQRDIKLDNPTYNELKTWFELSGQPIKKFFNTSGVAYKSLNLKEKLPNMTEDECLQLLATDGMLVKRPILVGDDFVLIGFKEIQWQENL